MFFTDKFILNISLLDMDADFERRASFLVSLQLHSVLDCVISEVKVFPLKWDKLVEPVI